MTAIKLKDVKRGDYIKRKENAKTVFIKSDYDRASKTFELYDTEDVNRFVYLKGSTIVYIGFDY